MTVYNFRIQEHEIAGKRLGRHYHFDTESLRYLTTAAPVIVSKNYPVHVPVFDQGQLGSCTGNATAGELCFDPFYLLLSPKQQQDLNESLAVELYKIATTLDDDTIPGHYPPDDTGSDGTSAAKAAVQLGLASGYTHGLSLEDICSMLQNAPCAIGINWYDSFDSPDANGNISISKDASVRGGHELCACALDTVNRKIRLRNSWGPGWGAGGYCWIGYSDVERLMAERGDATQLVSALAPAPTPTPPLPTPPSPTDANLALWYARTKVWMHANHVGSNKAAAQASITLAKAEGLE